MPEQKPRTPRPLESLDDAAARYDVSVRTVRRRIACGELTGYRFGARLLRVDPQEVDALFRPIATAGTVSASVRLADAV
jgi:excisionase family DNA binding protein